MADEVVAALPEKEASSSAQRHERRRRHKQKVLTGLAQMSTVITTGTQPPYVTFHTRKVIVTYLACILRCNSHRSLGLRLSPDMLAAVQGLLTDFKQFAGIQTFIPWSQREALSSLTTSIQCLIDGLLTEIGVVRVISANPMDAAQIISSILDPAAVQFSLMYSNQDITVYVERTPPCLQEQIQAAFTAHDLKWKLQQVTVTPNGCPFSDFRLE